MKSLIETSDSISAHTVGKVLAEGQATGIVELEIEGIGTQEVEIVSTPGTFGGYLRWFLCPGCGRRAGKLYMPRESPVFLCRSCHRLEYRQQALREFRKAPYEVKRPSRIEGRRLDELKIMKMLEKMLRGKE